MKRLTTLAVMLISLAASAQDTLKSKTTTGCKHLLFGVNISPDYCYRTLKNNDGSSTASAVIDLRNRNEKFKMKSSKSGQTPMRPQFLYFAF